MTLFSRSFALALAASVALLPSLGAAQDSARLLTQAAGSFEAVDEAISAATAPEAAAQPAGAAPDAAGAAPPAVTVPDAVELAALYYYAEQKQEDRVEREAERLRLKYPGFVLPDDLFVPAARRGADESLLWSLYEKSDFTGIDAEIVRRRSEAPDWAPTADFTAKLTRKKQQVLMKEAADDGNWTAVIQAAAGIDPKTETDAGLLYHMIDAYAATGQRKELADVYRGILLREGDGRMPPPVLVTVLQKAVRDFSAAEVQAVIDRIAVTPEMKASLAPVATDLLRKSVADFNADTTKTEALPAADIARLEQEATARSDVADLSLLGWYTLKIKQPAASAVWFRKALAVKEDAANAKGLYLSLAAQDLEEEAYQVAADHLDDLSGDPEFLMNALSLRFARPNPATIDEKIVASYSTTILQTLNADHAEILAWYAYNSKQFEAAEAWFGKAIEWKPAAARVKGLALSLLRLSQKDAFAALKTEYAEAYPEIWKEIQVAKPPKGNKRASSVDKPRGAVEANYYRNFKAKRYGACVSDIRDLDQRGQLGADAQQIGGWCYLGLSRLDEARAAFSAALDAGGKSAGDAAYGLALTYLRGRLTDEAERIADGYRLTGARDREVRAEIYVQRARSAFDRKQYKKALDALNTRASIVAEPADLTQLRAWSYYHLGDLATANEIFRRLNDHLSDAGVRRGLAATSRL
ncbi:tetratricopeptide repeat protein [Ensifer soli]|uniref:tetratricopeptide repeat protein n=1 Tax=Ciceribacter sp. sgz301302 TaxID=3342379 RepID=UPI0035BA8CFA